MIKTYRKRSPPIVSAIQYDGSNLDEIKDFLSMHLVELTDGSFCIYAEDEIYKVKMGDYVIKHTNHAVSALSEEKFNLTYERIS